MSMRYPTDRPQSADYVSFQHVKYSGRGGGGGGGGGGGIVLYMPAPAPAVSNRQRWNNSGETFAGPIGQFKRNLAQGGSDLIAGTENFNVDTFGKDLTGALERFQGTKVGDMARMFGQDQLARATGMTGQQLMSVTRGEIYNPNLEMFYEGPDLRDFDFSFQCAPKSSADAQAIRQIIMEFKKWSSPEESGDKLKLPHVWKISYGGKAKQYYNKFKTAALTNINVQYNAGIDSHMTFTDGSPIVTGFTLSFTETEIITRKDAGRY